MTFGLLLNNFMVTRRRSLLVSFITLQWQPTELCGHRYVHGVLGCGRFLLPIRYWVLWVGVFLLIEAGSGQPDQWSVILPPDIVWWQLMSPTNNGGGSQSRFGSIKTWRSSCSVLPFEQYFLIRESVLLHAAISARCIWPRDCWWGSSHCWLVVSQWEWVR